MNLRDQLRGVRFIYPLLSAGRRIGGRLLMRAFHALHGVDANTVLFSSYAGKSYSDNPRRISEALHALRPDARIVWQLLPGHMPSDLPDYVEVVPAHTLRALRAYSTARCFVDNFNRPQYMLKFPGQLYVQTWHGDRGFKKVLFDMGTNERFPDGAQMDLAVSGSEFGSRVHRTSFRYQGEILEVGCPRNDLLVNPPEGLAGRVRRALGVPDGARLLLYAPTFRDATAGKAQAAGFDLERAKAALEAATGERWICAARGHDLNAGVSSGATIDAGAWPEVSELLLATDLLITDYSSIGGDFMLLGRPVVYFQPDRADYDRELYFDPDTSPLIVAHSEAELLEILSGPIDAAANCRAVLEFFGTNETGRAAGTVAHWIADRLNDGAVHQNVKT